MSKPALILALSNWINKRPGLDPRDYIRGWDDKDGRAAYFAEARSITKDLHHARALLRYVEMRDTITPEMILEASRNAFSGRLTIKPKYVQNSGYYGMSPPEVCWYDIDYCVGQYWPTEYRRAVCGVLSSAIWDYLRESIPPETEHKGDAIRKAARRELGRPLASRWFS